MDKEKYKRKYKVEFIIESDDNGRFSGDCESKRTIELYKSTIGVRLRRHFVKLDKSGIPTAYSAIKNLKIKELI